MTTLNVIVFFAAQLAFDIYILFLLLRILLTLVGTDFYNPISHFIFTSTQFIVKPLQRLLPIYKGIDFAAIVVLVVFEFIKILFLVWIRFDNLPAPQGLIPWGIGEILNQIVNIYFYALLIRAILSWVGATMENPFFQITFVLTEPLLQPFRRWIPSFKGVDFLSLIMAFVLKAIGILVFVPMIRWGEIHSLSKFF